MTNEKNTINLKRLDIVLATIILVFSAISFYAFFYLMRETLRLLSLTYEYELLVLTESEIGFYNRFYAAIALIIGLGAASSFISNRPSFLNGSIIERTNTLNDSRVLNWVFLMWATQLGFTLGLFFSATYPLSEFSFYEEYRYLFILFIIVLYLQQWINYRKLFPSTSLKLFIPVSIIFIVLTYLMGSINFVDYNRLNQKLLDKNPYHKLSIEKPHSKSFKSGSNRFKDMQIYLGYPKYLEHQTPQLIFEKGIEIELNDIDSMIESVKHKMPSSQYPSLHCQLNIDKSIPMRIVDELRDTIGDQQIFKISYGIIPEGKDYNNQNNYRHTIIPSYYYHSNHIYNFWPEKIEGKELINVKPSAEGTYLNDVLMSDDELASHVDSIINASTNYIFEFVYPEDLTFGDFIGTYSKIYGTIKDNRDSYSIKEYQSTFDRNSRNIKKEIRNKYPLNIIDYYNRR